LGGLGLGVGCLVCALLLFDPQPLPPRTSIATRMATPRTRRQMRLCPNGTSPPPWLELSLWPAIEMQPSFHHASTPACTHACPVTPCLGGDSPRTVTHQRRRLAHCTLSVPDECTAARQRGPAPPLLGTNPPMLHRNSCPPTPPDAPLGNLHRPRGAHTSESVAVR
jgi:hypothetical protein